MGFGLLLKTKTLSNLLMAKNPMLSSWGLLDCQIQIHEPYSMVVLNKQQKIISKCGQLDTLNIDCIVGMAQTLVVLLTSYFLLTLDLRLHDPSLTK